MGNGGVFAVMVQHGAYYHGAFCIVQALLLLEQALGHTVIQPSYDTCCTASAVQGAMLASVQIELSQCVGCKCQRPSELHVAMLG